MGRDRFVSGKTKRIDISDGDWIDVKEELNIGEMLDVEGAGIEISQRPGDNEATYKFSRPGDSAVMRVAVWLAGWSLCDAASNKVVLSRDSVRRLDEGTFSEIRKVIDKHIEEKEKAEKKGDEGDSPN